MRALRQSGARASHRGRQRAGRAERIIQLCVQALQLLRQLRSARPQRLAVHSVQLLL